MALATGNLAVGSGGSILWGTTGITMPTSATAALTNFNDFGYLDEDGVTVAVTPDINEFPVWQSKQPGRRELNTQAIVLSGKFAEWNAQTVPKAFGGGTFTGTNGSYNFPATTASLDEFAVVADATDGGETHRFAFGRANQTGASEIQFNRQNLAVLPFEFGILAPAAGGSPGAYYFGGTVS